MPMFSLDSYESATLAPQTTKYQSFVELQCASRSLDSPEGVKFGGKPI